MGLPPTSPLLQNYAAVKAKPGEKISLRPDGTVWAGEVPGQSVLGYDANKGVLLGYTSIAPIKSMSFQVKAPLLIPPGWSIEDGVVLPIAGGALSLGFVRPDRVTMFANDLMTLGKAKIFNAGLVRPLSCYGQVAYAVLWGGVPPSSAPLSQWFSTSFLA